MMLSLTLLLVGQVSAGQATGRPADPVRDLLEDTNRIRTEQKLAALKTDEQLMKAATAMAADIAQSGNLEHKDSRGRKLGARVDAVGYRWKRVCENLAFNFDTATSVNAQWLESSGHRKNLLDPAVRDAGIGFAKDAEGHPYWVMIYGVKLSR